MRAMGKWWKMNQSEERHGGSDRSEAAENSEMVAMWKRGIDSGDGGGDDSDGGLVSGCVGSGAGME